jgi:hypothetical protein
MPRTSTPAASPAENQLLRRGNHPAQIGRAVAEDREDLPHDERDRDEPEEHAVQAVPTAHAHAGTEDLDALPHEEHDDEEQDAAAEKHPVREAHAPQIDLIHFSSLSPSIGISKARA